MVRDTDKVKIRTDRTPGRCVDLEQGFGDRCMLRYHSETLAWSVTPTKSLGYSKLRFHSLQDWERRAEWGPFPNCLNLPEAKDGLCVGFLFPFHQSVKLEIFYNHNKKETSLYVLQMSL